MSFSVTEVNTISQRPADIDLQYQVAVKRELKFRQKRTKQKKRKVPWTSTVFWQNYLGK